MRTEPGSLYLAGEGPHGHFANQSLNSVIFLFRLLQIPRVFYFGVGKCRRSYSSCKCIALQCFCPSTAVLWGSAPVAALISDLKSPQKTQRD